MTQKQIEQMADDLADKHRLSPQLTLAWLKEHGFADGIFPRVLIPRHLDELIEFASVHAL